MSVLTSKQIRNKIANQERAMFKPKRRSPRKRDVPTQETIDQVIAAHLRDMDAAIERGDSHWAGIHASRAVSYVRVVRAQQIARDYERAIWKARDCARHELYNCEV